MIRILIIAVFLAGIGGAYGGYRLRDQQAELETLQAVTDAIADYAGKRQKANAVYDDFIEQRAQTKTVYKTVIKEVKKYVPVKQSKDSDCNLSHGTVRLLDDAAKNIMPEAAAALDETDFTASRFNELHLIEFAHASIGRYNEARDQCNALMDWIDAMRD